MSREDALQKAQARLEALREQERALEAKLRDTGQRIREGATPSGLLKNAVSGVLQNKQTTAKAVLGLGAGLVLNNITRKQRRLSMIGKVTGLALGGIISAIAQRKQRKTSG